MRITRSWGNYDGEYNWNTEYSVLIPTRCSVETQTKRKIIIYNCVHHVTSCKKPVKALETSLETVDIMVKLGWTEIHQNCQASQTFIFKGSGRLPAR